MADQVVQKVIITMVDVAGKTGTCSCYVTASGGTDPIPGVADLITALNESSEAVVIRAVGQTANNTVVGTADDNVFDVRDKLAVEMVGSQNDHHTIHVPDPDPDIFSAANGEVVDPTSDAWLDLKTALVGGFKDKLGAAVSVIRGYRTRSDKLKTTLRFQ